MIFNIATPFCSPDEGGLYVMETLWMIVKTINKNSKCILKFFLTFIINNSLVRKIDHINL